ncbi:MAG: hypothetical protein V1810_00610, partial [Candidatus Beckwithbacteria bacterium]
GELFCVFISDQFFDHLKTEKSMKKIILIIIGIIIFLGIISSRASKTTEKSVKSSISSPTATEQPIIAVTDSEKEIFYKYFEYYQGLPTVQIEDKSRHNKAISLTAEEFHISTDEAEKIYEKVSKAKPTDKEIEIYEALETRLDEAIDSASSAESINEKAINNEVAKQYNISTTKLDAIYILVLSNTEYQEQRKSKVAQENKESQAKNLTENRKKILEGYIKKLDDVGMNQFIESVSYEYASTDECSIVVKVRNTWHYQLKQVRLQAAQNLWSLWSQSYYLESEKDKCRMELVDLNGNNVGGSSWLGGSLVNVKN